MTMTRGVVIAMAAVAVAADLLAHPHGEAWWNLLPGFDLIFGLAGCAVIVVVSKALGKSWLQRPERFYEDAGE